jgi:hypothetical protein
VAVGAHKQKALCRALSKGGRGFTTSVHACPLVRDVSDRAMSVQKWLGIGHLGYLDFVSERHGDCANFCVFNEEKDGESE